jgi:hypothetical protein
MLFFRLLFNPLLLRINSKNILHNFMNFDKGNKIQLLFLNLNTKCI